MVPEARVELARAQGPLDFESSASTSFTTPAASCISLYIKGVCECKPLFLLSLDLPILAVFSHFLPILWQKNGRNCSLDFLPSFLCLATLRLRTLWHTARYCARLNSSKVWIKGCNPQFHPRCQQSEENQTFFLFTKLTSLSYSNSCLDESERAAAGTHHG